MAFQQQGHVTIPYFEGHELRALLADIASSNGLQRLQGYQSTSVPVSYHCTFLDNDMAYKNSAFSILSSLFNRFLSHHLIGHRVVQTNIISKPPNAGIVCPHQNLTIVDEEIFTSLSLWCPLHDVNEKNGTLHVLSGSHRKAERYRGHEIEWPLWSRFGQHPSKGMTPLSVNAGDIVVFDDSLIHCSPSNNSDQDRVVFHALVAPNEAPLIYCRKKDLMVQVYRVSDDFWQQTSPDNEHCLGPLLQEVPYGQGSITFEQMIDGLEG